LIQYFWEATAVLVGITAGLLGASWKLFSSIDDNRTKYRDDSASLRAILITNELLPILVKFSSQLEQIRKDDPSNVEKMLEGQESNRTMKQILQVTRKIIDIEDIIKDILVKCNDCAYDFILLAIISAAFIPTIYFEPELVYYYIFVFVLAIILVKVAFDFVKYRKRIRLLIIKDNKIRENW
jgi:hypothetical protein